MISSSFPPKKQASDWLIYLVYQSEAQFFLAGRNLNSCLDSDLKKKLSGEENFKKGKIGKTRPNSKGKSMSKTGKFYDQNWKSDPMNSR